jgi:hypothetical protein
LFFQDTPPLFNRRKLKAAHDQNQATADMPPPQKRAAALNGRPAEIGSERHAACMDRSDGMVHGSHRRHGDTGPGVLRTTTAARVMRFRDWVFAPEALEPAEANERSGM